MNIPFFHPKPVVRARPEHCISRANIDPDALKVLYRLSSAGYTAYLVGGSVRDLLLGRTPKDFDVGTDARPSDIRHIFRNCFLIGRRFRLAHIVFGKKVIETSTFRRQPDNVPDEYAGMYQQEDNTFGNPEEDANRRDFTINGLFYDIQTFAIIDYVGGLKDLEKKIIRSIGDPNIRFQEDPVRMMRAVKFASRLHFEIERGTRKAIKKYHAEILKASVPRLCEEIFRLFAFRSARDAFKLMWEFGLLADLLPDLSRSIDESGGNTSPHWRYLEALDADPASGEASHAVCAACLYYPLFKAAVADERRFGGRRISRPMAARGVMRELAERLKVPRVTFFSAANLFDCARRFLDPPESQRGSRFLNQSDFASALQFQRVVLRAEGADDAMLRPWEAAWEKVKAGQWKGWTSDGTGEADEPFGGERPHRRRRRHRSRRFSRRRDTAEGAAENN